MALLKVANLRKVMEVKGWSQSDLARITGFNRSYIHRVLSGDRRPNADFVMGLMKVLPGFKQEEFFLPEVVPIGDTDEASNHLEPDKEASHA